MENDAVFEAEAHVDHRLRDSSPSPHYDGQDLGVDAVTSTYGAVTRKDVDYEDTPLLSRIDNGVTDAEERGHNEPPAWHGERDFEGKTWWNRPSVRFHLL